jgi:hypothetical protein
MFPTFRRNTVPSSSGVGSPNPWRWRHCFLNFGSNLPSDEASYPRTQFSITLPWKPQFSLLILCFKKESHWHEPDGGFRIIIIVLPLCFLSYPTSLSISSIPASYSVRPRFRISAKTPTVLTQVFRSFPLPLKVNAWRVTVQATTASCHSLFL